MNIPDEYKNELEELAKRIAAQGRLVEAGWLGFRAKVIPPNAGTVQIEECRRCFFSGCAHLFYSLLTVMGPGSDEPSEDDMAKMALIDDELRRFIQGVKDK